MSAGGPTLPAFVRTVAGAALSLGLCLALGFLPSPAAHADTQLIEVVGVVPVPDGGLATRDVREAAVQVALREAVMSVARQLLIDASPSEDGDSVDDVRITRVLGNQVLPYTTRYRIVDDQGERPVMFGDAGAEGAAEGVAEGAAEGVAEGVAGGVTIGSEYVLVVEVSVETSLVEQRLVEEGLLAEGAGAVEAPRLRVEVRGLVQHPGYVAMRKLIRDTGRASSVQPVAFARGLVVFEVALPGANARHELEALVERLVSAGPPALEIELVEIDDLRIVLDASFTPPLAPVALSEGDLDSPRGD